jgi:hypothetical protein
VVSKGLFDEKAIFDLNGNLRYGFVPYVYLDAIDEEIYVIKQTFKDKFWNVLKNNFIVFKSENGQTIYDEYKQIAHLPIKVLTICFVDSQWKVFDGVNEIFSTNKKQNSIDQAKIHYNDYNLIFQDLVAEQVKSEKVKLKQIKLYIEKTKFNEWSAFQHSLLVATADSLELLQVKLKNKFPNKNLRIIDKSNLNSIETIKIKQSDNDILKLAINFSNNNDKLKQEDSLLTVREFIKLNHGVWTVSKINEVFKFSGYPNIELRDKISFYQQELLIYINSNSSYLKKKFKRKP